MGSCFAKAGSPGKTYCLPRRTILLSRFHRADYFYSHRTHKYDWRRDGGSLFACLIMRVSGAGIQNYGPERPAVINAVVCKEFSKIDSYSWRDHQGSYIWTPGLDFTVRKLQRASLRSKRFGGQAIILLRKRINIDPSSPKQRKASIKDLVEKVRFYMSRVSRISSC